MNKLILGLFLTVLLSLVSVTTQSWAASSPDEKTQKSLSEINDRLKRMEETQATLLEQQAAILENIKQLKVWIRRT